MMKILDAVTENKDVVISKFTGGECHVQLQHDYSPDDKVRIHIRLNTSDDVMTLLLIVDALRNANVSYIEAFFPYIPYARQDRIVRKGEALSIKVFANMINDLGLQKIHVYDAHSDVSSALLNYCHNISNHVPVKHFIDEMKLEKFVLVSPDLGAYKKTNRLAQFIDYKDSIAIGIKTRDPKTGSINKSDVISEDLKNSPCLIVDDICDGGNTIRELSKALKKKSAGKLYLIVSHGIFSRNAFRTLKESGIEMICSSNSIADRPVEPGYLQYNIWNVLD